MLRFFANAIRMISAVALVVLAIAVTPTVATALAHSRPTINDAVNSNQSPADESCAAFEAWFLDPACSNVHVKKAARTKRHLTHNAGR